MPRARAEKGSSSNEAMIAKRWKDGSARSEQPKSKTGREEVKRCKGDVQVSLGWLRHEVAALVGVSVRVDAAIKTEWTAAE